jgi:drug/metabolite transporter (DMT)-like permease|tara:strand:- start:412 stop:1317 length:906 start_codon:yes stop_codon:yes gene_type:complete
MSNRFWALLAAMGTATIYGLNHTIAKVIMPHYVGAFGFVFIRLFGAVILFWIISLFLKKEKIDRGDFMKIFIGSLLGMCINMLSFLKGLQLSTPVNSGIFATLVPIMILVLSYIFLGEKISNKKIYGVLLGFMGALLLVISVKENSPNAPNVVLGNILLMVNSSFYAAYVIVVKPLTQKYSTVTIMKWMFLSGFIISFPITISEFNEIDFPSLPFDAIWRIGFVIIGTTFMTYLLSFYALKTLQASTFGVFAYAQPLIAIFYAVASGNDFIDMIKIVACILTLSGVYLVSKKPSLKKEIQN